MLRTRGVWPHRLPDEGVAKRAARQFRATNLLPFRHIHKRHAAFAAISATRYALYYVGHRRTPQKARKTPIFSTVG